MTYYITLRNDKWTWTKESDLRPQDVIKNARLSDIPPDFIVTLMSIINESKEAQVSHFALRLAVAACRAALLCLVALALVAVGIELGWID